MVFYKGNIIADGNLTIAALNKLTSKEVNKKSNEELRIKGNMKVGAVEDEFMRLYNIKVQIKDAAEKKLIPNDITIGQGARGEYK